MACVRALDQVLGEHRLESTRSEAFAIPHSRAIDSFCLLCCVVCGDGRHFFEWFAFVQEQARSMLRDRRCVRDWESRIADGLFDDGIFGL